MIIFYISLLFISKCILADTKYHLQTYMGYNTLLPPHYICHKQCCFIQLPFPTSICSPCYDIMIIFYISLLFIWKFIMADTKYDLQTCMGYNKNSPPHYICHKKCCFIQFPFPTSICIPCYDNMIICLYFLIVYLKIYNGTYKIWPLHVSGV